jgi:hypothetical protein
LIPLLEELGAENVAACWREGWSGGCEEEEGPASVEKRRTRPPRRPKREAECGDEGDVGVAVPEEVGDEWPGEGILGG